MQWTSTYCLLGVGGAAVACDRPEMQAEGAPARVVDSILPRDEALRRFRARPAAGDGAGRRSGEPRHAGGGFLRALESGIPLALASMAVTRPEFAYLYYPTTPQSLPPYDLEPGLMWHLLLQRSDRGIRRSLAAYGGQRLRLLSHDCGTGGESGGRQHHIRARASCGSGTSGGRPCRSGSSARSSSGVAATSSSATPTSCSDGHSRRGLRTLAVPAAISWPTRTSLG